MLSRCAVATVLLLLGCAAKQTRPHPALDGVWREYVELPAERALAIAGDPLRPNWVAGSSGGHDTRKEARDAALAECGRRRAARRMQAACRLYAVGSEIVWTGPE